MSNYNDNVLPEDEKLEQCPYHKAHMVLKFRMSKHLEKCRRQYTGKDMRKCRFNINHIIPEPEIARHEKHCSDRLLIEQFIVNQSESQKRKSDETSTTETKRPRNEGRDEWDDAGESHSDEVVIDRRKRVEESSTHIVHFQHMTKSERNAEREARHRRIVKQQQSEANGKSDD